MRQRSQAAVEGYSSLRNRSRVVDDEPVGCTLNPQTCIRSTHCHETQVQL